MPVATILVEDIATIRNALIPSMRELGAMDVIAVAETAAEALRQLEDHKSVWRIAVVDLFLRQGNGFTVLHACRNRRKDQFVVMLTNYATPEIRSRCLELGADAVFDKSTELDAFFEHCSRYARSDS